MGDGDKSKKHGSGQAQLPCLNEGKLVMRRSASQYHDTAFRATFGFRHAITDWENWAILRAECDTSHVDSQKPFHYFSQAVFFSPSTWKGFRA